jgi:opacity protein-like surface antigen
LIIPVAAQAQSANIEITPTIGYRWGGTVDAWATDMNSSDAELDDGSAYGLVVDIPITRGLQLELMADRQSTGLIQNRSYLWVPLVIDVNLDVTYYHVGLLWQWQARKLNPYIVGSIGVADLDLDVPGANDETRFSTSFGGGLKLWLSDHVGFRVEGRGYWTDTGNDDCWGGGDEWCDWDWYGDDLVQGEVKVGVIFTF